MAGLTGTQIKTTYGDVLQLGNAGAGITASVQTIADGLGNASAIGLSTTALSVNGQITAPAATLIIINAPSGQSIICRVNNTESCRITSGGLQITNGADLILQSHSSSLGGSNVNNFGATGAGFQRWSSTAPINVTGMVGATDGTTRYIWNVGANTITLTNQDAASSAANQWLTSTGANLALAANKCALATYDATTAAWRVTLLP